MFKVFDDQDSGNICFRVVDGDSRCFIKFAGAPIDEVTNVYAMGAAAFALFGDERDRCAEKWKLSKELFDIAKRAVSDGRSQRQPSIEQLIAEWRAAE